MICRKCREDKPIDDFMKSPRNKGGVTWCHKCEAERSALWRHNNPERVKLLRKQRYQENMIKQKETGRDGYRKRKVEVLTYYGSGKLACVKCGFSDIWLKRNNFPSGYQTLCMNCQYTKKIEEGEI